MAWNKPVTNTKPATQTDEGPYGSTRAKSADGQYTASSSSSVPAVVSDQEQMDALEKAKALFKFRKKQRSYPLKTPDEGPKKEYGYEQYDANRIRKAVDEKLNTPLFEKLFRRYFIDILLVPYLKPGQTIDFAKTSDKVDRTLGIDYTLTPAVEGNDFLVLDKDDEFYDIDLKSPNGAHGNSEEAQKFYENSQISFTLYKKKYDSRTGQNYYGKGNYYTSKATHNCYVIAKTNRTEEEIAQGLDPEVTNAKMFFAPSKDMHNYIDKRVLEQQTIKNIIQKYKDGWTNLDDMIEQVNSQGYHMERKKDKRGRPLEDSYVITVPIPGENFGIDIALNKYDENRSDIRMFVSDRMFYTKEFKDIAKRKVFNFANGIKLNKINKSLDKKYKVW